MLKTITTVVATLAVAGITCAEDAVQWTEAEGGNGHWYEYNETIFLWDEHKAAAESEGGMLACILDQAESDFVGNLMLEEYNIDVWIGGFPSGGGFEWVSGEPFSFSNWSSTEPSGGFGIEICGRSWACEFGKWYVEGESSPNWEGNPAIYEYSADCNGDGLVDYGQILDGSLADDNGNGVPDCCDDTSCLPAVQWKVEDGGNGHWYKVIINDTALCWPEAEATAMSTGGQLASLETVEEFNFASTHIDSQGGSLDTWIGLRQDEDGAEPADGWRWLSGVELDYNLWLGSLDDGNGCQDYARLEAGGCDDVYPCVEEECIHSTYEDQMLVEWSEDCNGDGIVDYGQILDGSLADENGNGIPDICQQVDMGACCLAGTCVMTTVTHCFEALGSYAGDGITCEDAGCPAPCPGDIDGDGQIGIVELLVVIDRWGICP